MKRCLLALGFLVLVSCKSERSLNPDPKDKKDNPEYVRYEDFGAVGDGKTDDQAALVAAHAYANEKHLPVRATDGKTYYIGKGSSTIVIQYDVDFGNANFIIDDVVTDNYSTPVFTVASTMNPIDINGLSPLKRGQTNIGKTLPQDCLVQVEDSNRKVYIRKGANKNNGTAMKEVLVVSKTGEIREDSPVIWDYGSIKSAIGYPMNSKLLKIKGGIFLTIANQAESKYTYYNRGFSVERSNVEIDGMVHKITGELDHGAPYNNFIKVIHCADVVVKNCVFTGHRTYTTIGSAGTTVGMGSYDIQPAYAVNVKFSNCTQTNDINDDTYWGVFASNFCKSLSMDNCRLSRFDAHQGVANVMLDNCEFGHMGCRLVGFGDLKISNCRFNVNYAIFLRADYGSSWDGDIVLKDCVIKVPMRDQVCIIKGSNVGDHDFGYDCRLPYTLTIDGLEIDDSVCTTHLTYNGPMVFSDFSRDATKKGLIPFPADVKVDARRVSVATRRTLQLSTNKAMFKDASFTLE